MPPRNLLGGFVLLLAASFSNARLTTVTDWGENPTGLTMSLSVPATVAESPAIILAASLPYRKTPPYTHTDNVIISCTYVGGRDNCII